MKIYSLANPRKYDYKLTKTLIIHVQNYLLIFYAKGFSHVNNMVRP